MGLAQGHHDNPHYGQRQSDPLLDVQLVAEEQDGDGGDEGDPQPFPQRKRDTNGDCPGGLGEQQVGEGDEEPHRQIVDPAALALWDQGHGGGAGDLGQDGPRQEEAGQKQGTG